MMVLEKETETYLKNEKTLLQESLGKFVLIKDTQIVGVFESQNDAITQGINKYGNTPFLVRKIEQQPSIQNFTSNLIYCDEKCHQ